MPTRLFRHLIWRIIDFKRKLQSRGFDYCHFRRYLGKFDYNSQNPESGANPAQPTAVWILRYIFRKNYRIKPEAVLVDVGCGYGRVIMWWVKSGCKNRIYGIEIDPVIAEKTQRSFAKFPNVEIISGDALEKLPRDGTMFYLFNPFQLKVVLQFKKLIAENYPPGITIVYYFPRWIEVFRADERFEVTEYPPKISKLTGEVKTPWTAVILLSEKYNRVIVGV